MVSAIVLIYSDLRGIPAASRQQAYYVSHWQTVLWRITVPKTFILSKKTINL